MKIARRLVPMLQITALDGSRRNGFRMFVAGQSSDFGNRLPHIILAWARVSILPKEDDDDSVYTETTIISEAEVPADVRLALLARIPA